MHTHRSVAALLCAVVLSSCDLFDKSAVQTIAGPVPAGARIRFFNFGVNAPGVNFYANDTKITAITSATGTESTLGVAYGAVGLGGFYSAIEPGQYTLSGRIAATVDKNLAISNVPATLETGKFYSAYQSGFYNTTAKTVDGFIVEDDFAAQIDYSVAYVRFVHAISNANPMTLYVRNPTSGEEITVGAERSYKGAGAFTAVPSGVYTVITRYTGSPTNVISRADVSFSAGRVYTIGARGDITVVSTTATNRPFLDNTANR
jgi:hypothetical protein